MKKAKIEIYSNRNFLIDKAKLKNMIDQMIEFIGKRFENIEISFLTDQDLFEINKKHLNHLTYTDIITFTYVQDEPISSEILISYERAFENSKKFNESFENEILRLVAHGLLHSIGIKDKTASQKTKMRKLENDLLSKINKSDFIKRYEIGSYK